MEVKEPSEEQEQHHEEQGTLEEIKRIYDPDNQEAVDYYSKKEAKLKEERKLTETYNHRVFNNWIKSVLIDKYSSKVKSAYQEEWEDHLPLSVLDIACGKGGDLRKWDLAGTRNYYGVDIAYKAIQDATQRKIRSFKNFCTTFIQKDASSPPDQFFHHFPEGMFFDMVSCQFSMHYMFKSEEKVRNFLQNAANRLNNGGYFICTHPDCNVIVKKLRERHVKDSRGRYVAENNFYSLIIDDLKISKEKGPFGHPYGFFLGDGLVGDKFETKDDGTVMIYVPEYLIIFDKFVELAKEYGLELQESKNFHDFYAENIQNQKYFDVFKFKIRFDFTGESPLLMDPELWDVSYLYRVAAFKKISGPEVHEMDRSIFRDRSYFKIHRNKKKRKFTLKDRIKRKREDGGEKERTERDRGDRDRERHRDRERGGDRGEREGQRERGDRDRNRYRDRERGDRDRDDGYRDRRHGKGSRDKSRHHRR